MTNKENHVFTCTGKLNNNIISRVFRPEWYISTIYIIVEIYHSGRKSLIWKWEQHTTAFHSNTCRPFWSTMKQQSSRKVCTTTRLKITLGQYAYSSGKPAHVLTMPQCLPILTQTLNYHQRHDGVTVEETAISWRSNLCFNTHISAVMPTRKQNYANLSYD